MTVLYPIVLETEASGAVSAYVPGLPVYAAAETPAKAERAIRDVLAAYLEAHPASRPDARVRVARFSNRGKTKVDIVGVAALVGAQRSATKARASRERPAWWSSSRYRTRCTTTRQGARSPAGTRTAIRCRINCKPASPSDRRLEFRIRGAGPVSSSDR